MENPKKETFYLKSSDFEEPFYWTDESERQLEKNLEEKRLSQFYSVEQATNSTNFTSSATIEEKDHSNVSIFWFLVFQLLFFHAYFIIILLFQAFIY